MIIKERVVKSVDSDGKPVTVIVKRPTPEIYRKSQIAYNKAFREALDSGAMLKEKLKNYFEEQGIWNKAKDAKYAKLLGQITASEEALKKGGIPLKEAKEKAIDLKQLRLDFAELIATKQSHDANSVESQADNARFNHLIITCILRENRNVMWENLEEYDADAVQPWALEAAQELAQMLYGLDPDYEKGLVENKFLVKYKFADEDLRFRNKDGHLTDFKGRLVNEEGRYIAYRDDGSIYFVNSEGVEVTEEGEIVVEFTPFLDDEGNPIEEEVNIPKNTENVENTDESIEKETPVKKPRKK